MFPTPLILVRSPSLPVSPRAKAPQNVQQLLSLHLRMSKASKDAAGQPGLQTWTYSIAGKEVEASGCTELWDRKEETCPRQNGQSGGSRINTGDEWWAQSTAGDNMFYSLPSSLWCVANIKNIKWMDTLFFVMMITVLSECTLHRISQCPWGAVMLVKSQIMCRLVKR